MNVQRETIERLSGIAERCIGHLADAARNVDSNNWAGVYHDLGMMHTEIISGDQVEQFQKLGERFASVSEGTVRHFGFTKPMTSASAHEAIAEICQQAYFVLMMPLEGIKDLKPWEEKAKWLLSQNGQGLLIDRQLLLAKLLLERARLLAQLPILPAESPPVANQPPQSRITVDLKRKQLTFDGTVFDLNSELALRWIKVLVEREGQWLSSKELEQFDGLLAGARTHILKKHLPESVRSLIQSQTGAGSRLVLYECAVKT